MNEKIPNFGSLKVAYGDALIGNDICNLPRNSPYIIFNVSKTQFSVVRFSGTCRFNGYNYTYMPKTDELWRDDFLQWITKKNYSDKRFNKELVN